MNRIHRHLSTVTALTSLERYGKQSSSTYGKIDDLTCSYDGNHLTAISDNAPIPTISGSFDFKDEASTTAEFLYDENGLRPDVTKGNNNRVVVAENDSIVQINHYYPYGGVIGDISTNESVQKYKFEGKELDRTFGLDNYDIHARQYFAMAPMWDRIDPLTEDNPQFSPYSYCMGDPVNLGDYDGMDIWEIDNEGRIRKHIEDTTQDAFYMVELNDSGEYERTFTIDEDGNNIYNSISFAYGTIESQRSVSYSPNKKDVDKYDIYQVRGDENGKALFEFFGRNVAGNRIEVGHIMCGVEGEKGLNFVLNSHHKPEYYVEDGVERIKSSEPATKELYNNRLIYGYHIRAFIHSHPNSINPSKADMEFKRRVEHNSRILGAPPPQTKIWHVKTGVYYDY